MFDFQELRIPTGYPVKSLAWEGDSLVDWAGGGHRYFLDGTNKSAGTFYAYPFDASVTSPSGAYTAIYTRQHTKALILHHGELIREINRSYYCAEVHEYPIALFRLSSGQEVIAHCPEKYNELVIDDLETGERLTKLKGRDPSDYFFSRLAVDAKGEFLISAGWSWHPIDIVKIYHIESGLRDPAVFDGLYANIDTHAEDTNAAFMENGHLLVILSEVWDTGDEETPEALTKEPQPFGVFRVFDPRSGQMLRQCLPKAQVGTIMPVSDSHVVGFFDHPKLFDLHTGEVVHSWPHLNSGTQMGCLTGMASVPPMALDMENRRFAIASKSEIIAVHISPTDH